MNNQRLIYKGITERIRRAIKKQQLWKLIELHMWQLSFPLEATHG